MEVQLTGNVCLIRGRDTAEVVSFLEKRGVVVRGNPDIYVRTYGQFGIDDAHDLTSRALTRSMGKNGRIFVISATLMTTEAQNALLKTIEEPPGNARFFFIVPSPETLLSTVRSRAQIYLLDTSDIPSESADARAFLAATPAQRLELLKPLLEKGDDDKRDIGAVMAFLSSLEQILASLSHTETSEGLAEACREGVKSVYRTRKYISDRGALLKPLLESLALLCPHL